MAAGRLIRVATSREIAAVRRQLGRDDIEFSGVPAACRLGYPMVVYHDPCAGRKPNPTLFWLTCPWLKFLIDRLESVGGVRTAEAALRDDPGLAGRFRGEQEFYNAFLRGKAELDCEPGTIRDRFAGLHIGGSAEPLTVKCLHAHAAARLAGFPTWAGDLALDGIAAADPAAVDFILGREALRRA